MNESTDTAARERLEALVGEWAIEAGPPGGPPWPGAGRVTFDWLDGVPLLVARSHVDGPGAPDGVAVIGCDGISGAYYQLYTDERDVQRVYEMSLSDSEWKLWRDGQPSPSASRGGSQMTAGRSSPAGTSRRTVSGRRIST
jgi:hypothetical protein